MTIDAETIQELIERVVAAWGGVGAAEERVRGFEIPGLQAAQELLYLPLFAEIMEREDESAADQAKMSKYPVLQAIAEGRMSVEDFDKEDMVIAGDPDKIVRKVERYEKAGVDHLLCYMQVGYLKHEHILRSIELIGREVIPHFRSRVPAGTRT